MLPATWLLSGVYQDRSLALLDRALPETADRRTTNRPPLRRHQFGHVHGFNHYFTAPGASIAVWPADSRAAWYCSIRLLTDAAVRGKIDHLLGLKENVIMGHLIPAGTGLMSYDRIELQVEADEDEELVFEEASAEIEQEPLSAISEEAAEK